MSRQLTHGPSHESLLRDVSAAATPAARSRLDAIVVPAARPASALQDVITLSATLSVPLVILCSRQAQVGQVVRRVERTFGARALVVDVPENYKLPYDAPLTSGLDFKMASAGRSSKLDRRSASPRISGAISLPLLVCRIRSVLGTASRRFILLIAARVLSLAD